MKKPTFVNLYIRMVGARPNGAEVRETATLSLPEYVFDVLTDEVAMQLKAQTERIVMQRTGSVTMKGEFCSLEDTRHRQWPVNNLDEECDQ